MSASDNIVNRYSTTMITIYQDVIKNYESSVVEIKEAEAKLNDIYHAIEFEKSKDMYSGWKMYSEIKELRLRRREAKERVELLQDMYDYFNTQFGQQFKSQLQKLQGNSVKIREAQERRYYVPKAGGKVITDINPNKNSFQNMLDRFNETKISSRNGKLYK